ncbi:MAG TPA: glutathionylspermidine synthase family protein [Terriglobales bacterium]|jgi:glutathionylspermidine synthase
MTLSLLSRPLVFDDSLHSASVPFVFGPEVPEQDFQSIQRRLCLDYFKWDIQVGDISTLFRQPLLISRQTWEELSTSAETLADELMSLEQEIFERPDIHRMLGLPKQISKVFRKAGQRNFSNSASRTLRFDFHYTREGWRISEVNSDVPGGYIEASRFTELMASLSSTAKHAGDPARIWADSRIFSNSEHGHVALLSAPGFLEDQQVTMFLAAQLEARGFQTHLIHHPGQLEWKSGFARITAGKNQVNVEAIIRFYQAEWLAQLSPEYDWEWLLANGKTPVINPGSAILTESKRLPLVFDRTQHKMTAWKRLSPRSFDPRDVDWLNDGSMVVKAAFSNTGDSVHIREFMGADEWKKLSYLVKKRPEEWAIQSRFDPIAIPSYVGMVCPCIGVFTIEGRAAGVYARVSTNRITDFSAMDAALLIDEKGNG